MIGRSWCDFLDEEGKSIAKSNIKNRRIGIDEIYDFRLTRKDSSLFWVCVSSKSLFDNDGKFAGSLSMFTDITKRKESENALAHIETARKKEIHHRIKNNLQVISSLLDLQAEKLNRRNSIDISKILEALRESQNRVISIALIHEELYEGEVIDVLNFSLYLQRLTKSLFETYRLENADVNLKLDLEESIFFDMDIAVPLGIIVNELVSNSLKHAFSGRSKGTIRIKLFSEEARNEPNNDGELIGKVSGYTLIVLDDGVGIPENIDLENSDTLGLQLVVILIDQLDGEIELKKSKGTEFKIRFSIKQN